MIARFHYDDSRLAQLLRDEPGDGANELLKHLDTCQECQDRLDTLSSGGLSWNEVNDLMRKDDHPVPQPDGLSEGPREEPKAIAASATFLQPSGHPDSLGQFARYEVIEFLGRGGMGIVMRTLDPELDRQCAVKILAPELASNAAARRRFSREAKSAAAVVHPHVVPIQTVDEHDGLPYLVMPVVDGTSLQQRTEIEGPLSIIETVRIASQVADGLAAAHAQGLVHRDIKPANILLENGLERVQITDFGLARAIDDASMTRSGVIAGTPQYMSPEQAHGDAIDHRSDLFSLGSVMYFMLTGRSPFRAETTMGVLNRIGNDHPRSLRRINADVPEWLDAIVMKLLSKSRDDRFVSAEEVAELLGRCLAHVQEPATTPLPDRIANLPVVADHSKRLDSPDTPEFPERGGSSESRGGFRHPPIRWIVAMAGFAFFAFAGVIIFLETGKGTLRIESNHEADVPIAIHQGGDVVQRFTVPQQGTTTRLRAGKYTLRIDDTDSALLIAQGDVVLERGGQWIARIAESPGRSQDLRASTPSFDVNSNGKVGGQQLGAGEAQELPSSPSSLRTLPIESSRPQPLIGKWRLLRWLNKDREQATEVAPDESVMTVEGAYVTVSTQSVSPDERYFYRLLAGDVLHLVETSESGRGGTETKIKYSFPDSNSLRFENLSSTGDESGWGSEWRRSEETTKQNAAKQNQTPHSVPSLPSTTDGFADGQKANPESGSATSSDDQAGDLLFARKTNMLQLKVPRDAQFDPSLQIEWDVDEGISWLFSEPPIRREKLGSFPYCFNLGPNLKGHIPMINSRGRRIEAHWWMECQSANDRFWETIRGKKIEIRVSDEDFNLVADGGSVRMTIYVPESYGEYANLLLTAKSSEVNAGVLEVAKERGQPIISVLLEPANDRGSHKIEWDVDSGDHVTPAPRRDDDRAAQGEWQAALPSSAPYQAISDEGKTLLVRLRGDKQLRLADPRKPEQVPQTFPADGIVVPFSLAKPGDEACYHILDSKFNSIRASIRLECSEFLTKEHRGRLSEQPIELSVSLDDFRSVLSGHLKDRVIYLPKADNGNLLQTKTYYGINSPNDVVEDARKLGGKPIASIRLDPPTSADKVATSHKRVGSNFDSGRSTVDYFNRCSDEELLRALQGDWIQTQSVFNAEEAEEFPTTIGGKPIRLVFDGTTFQWNSVDIKTNTLTRETFELAFKGPSKPRSFRLAGNESYDDGLSGILKLTPGGELTVCLGRVPSWSFDAKDHFLIRAVRSEESEWIKPPTDGLEPETKAP